MADYISAADALTDRIAALGPQILALESPWELFKVPGFSCGDLEPTLYQASFALAKAQERLRRHGVAPRKDGQ